MSPVEGTAAPSAGWGRVPADDALAIGALLVRCARLVDAGAWTDLDRVLTEDAVVSSRHGTAHGPAEFAERARADVLDPHHVTDTVLRRIDDDRVRAWSKWFTVGPAGAVLGGEQLDVCVRTPAGWRIAERRVEGPVERHGATGSTVRALGVRAFLG